MASRDNGEGRRVKWWFPIVVVLVSGFLAWTGNELLANYAFRVETGARMHNTDLILEEIKDEIRASRVEANERFNDLERSLRRRNRRGED